MPAPVVQRILAPSRKQRPSFEVVCELVFRPIAHLLVLLLAPLRVPPPAVVVTAATTGIGAAVLIASHHYAAGALLLVLKTILDNADGQLARATNQITVLGRYLDSESDLLVNAFVFAALGIATGHLAVAAISFLCVTLALGVDFNLERLYRAERGEPFDPMPPATGIAGVLAHIYRAVYAPQDVWIERYCERRLRRATPAQRLAYHDRATLQLLANFGLSSQLAVLSACLAFDTPTLYLWLGIGCAVTLIPLELRRGRRQAHSRL